MANDLAAIRDKILARGLMTLRELAVMPRLVNGDYSREAAEEGDTIDVPIPVAMTTSAVTPSNVSPVPVSLTPAKVQIQLNDWRKSQPFHLTDKDAKEVDRNRHFMPMQAAESIKALANYVNTQIHSKYKGIYGWVGQADETAAIDPFGTNTLEARRARKVLLQQVCPKSDRRGVLDFDAGEAALGLAAFADAEKTADQGRVKMEGEIGRKFGFDWVEDDAVVTHTTTASLADWLVNQADHAVGDEVVTVDTGATAGAEGDVFTVAGDSQTYVVKSTTATTISYAPAAKKAWADNAAITFKASHKVNLGMHRDAFAFANRPLLTSQADAVGRNFRTITDAQTGISLRLEILPQYKQTAWEFDILFGTELVRAALACRIAGAV